jgi:putative ABC transport system substrate-binding protein
LPYARIMAAYQGESMNNRRKLLIMFGAGALAAPLYSFAQPQGKVWRIGFLSARNRPVSLDADEYGGFPRGMRELGYVEGKTVAIEWRFAENKRDRIGELAAELVQSKQTAFIERGFA